MESFRDAEIHLKKINASAPTTLAEPDLSFKDDEDPLNDPHLWRGK